MKKIIISLCVATLPITVIPVTLLQAHQGGEGSIFANGIASFYANKFNGRRTANGEVFDNSKMTAAHKTLKFGTIVRVTNHHNGRQVTVRINDRGPWIKGRVIDLSRAAAREIGMIKRGTARVKLELVH